MTKEEVRAYREELEGIEVKGSKCPKPIKTWAQCGVEFKILQQLKRLVGHEDLHCYNAMLDLHCYNALLLSMSLFCMVEKKKTYVVGFYKDLNTLLISA